MGKKKHAKHAKSKKHPVSPQQRPAAYPVIELLDQDGFPIKNDDIVELLDHGEFPHTPPNVVTLFQYEITNEPILDWPPHIQKQVEKMHEQIRKEPEAAILQMERLIHTYPHVPQFCNYMAVAYENLGKQQESTFWVYECYRRHPDYLFGKSNLIHHYLKLGNLKEAEKILDGKFDLKQLYPDRDVFHITEAICFFGAVGKYFWLTGDWQRAQLYYNMLKKLGADNCHVQWLQSRLHPFIYFLTSLFSWHSVGVILKLLIYLMVIIIALPLLLLEIVWRNTVGRLVSKIVGK